MAVYELSDLAILGVLERGVARSTKKLAMLSKMSWNLHIISVEVGTGKRFRDILARDERQHLGVFFASPGERYLVIFSRESGQALLNASPYGRSMVKPVTPGSKQPMLAEMANILINGLSGEIAERQGMERIISAPKSLWASKREIYNQAFGDLPCVDEDSMVSALIHISSPALASDCMLMIRMDKMAANFLLNTDPDVRPSGIISF